MPAATNAFENEAANIQVITHAYEPPAAAPATFNLLIDLDNGGGLGPHTHSADAKGIKLHWTKVMAIREEPTDAWATGSLLITRIDETDADLYFLGACALGHANNAYGTQSYNDHFPVGYDLTVEGGKGKRLRPGGLNSIMNLPALNTSTPIPNIAGTPTIPAVGDVVSNVFWHSLFGGDFPVPTKKCLGIFIFGYSTT